jgi:signal transduction histidine kinase
LTGCPALARTGHLPYTLTSSNGQAGVFVVPVDIDGDSVDELLRMTLYQTTMLTQNGQYVWDRRSSESLMQYTLGPVPTPDAGKGKRLVVVPARDTRGPVADSLGLYVLRADSGDDDRPGYGRYYWTVRVESIAHVPRRDPSWSIGAVSFSDVNGDGQQEALASVVSGYGLQPRGVYAVDLVARKVLWCYRTGFNPGDISVADVDGDGQDEFVVGGTSPGNGGAENGMSDHTNYVLCLGRDGARKWFVPLRRVGSGGYVWVGVADLNGDGKKEVVAVDHCILTGSLPDRLLVLDGSNGRLLDSAIADSVGDPRFLSLTVADLDGDSKYEVIVTRPDGRIETRNEKLRVTHEVSLKGEITLIRAVPLLPTRGEQLITVSTYANILSVLDGGMRLCAEYTPLQPPDKVQALSQGKGKPARLLVRLASLPGSGDPNTQFSILTATPTPRPFPWPLVSGMLGVLLLLAVLAILYTRRSYAAQLKYIAGGLVDKAGVVQLDQGGRIAVANDTAKRLLSIGEDCAGKDFGDFVSDAKLSSLRQAVDEVITGKDTQVRFDLVLEEDREFHTYQTRVSKIRFFGYLISMERLIEVQHAQRQALVLASISFAAHRLRSPLRTLKDWAVHLPSELKDVSLNIIRLDRLLRLTKEITALGDTKDEAAVVDVNRIVVDAVAVKRSEAPPELAVGQLLDPSLPSVTLRARKLQYAVESLLENAIEATGGSGNVNVTTKNDPAGRVVIIEVADTGAGIAEQHLAALGKGFFTTKENGTGLGLFSVFSFAHEHRGHVDIESKPGKGTKVRIVIPAEEEGHHNDGRR